MLRSVEIQNFRSCVKTSFSLDTSLSALCGRNGVGKTNVLKAIEWACATAIKTDRVWPGSGLTPYPEDNGRMALELGVELDGEAYRYRLEVPTKVLFESVEEATSSEIPLESLSVGSNETVKTIFHRSPDGVEVMGQAVSIRIPRMAPGLAALSSLLPEDDPAVVHLHRVRRFFSDVRYYSLDDVEEPERLITEQEYAGWKLRHQGRGDIGPSLTMRLLYMYREEPELFDEVKAILGPDGLDVVDDVAIRVFEASANGHGSTADSKRSMLLLIPSRRMGGSGKAGASYLFSSLSVGTRRAIRIVTSVLFDRRSLMLMEQPEDSIHPGLLYKLVDLLRTYSDDTQLLFTTHSPAVLDMLGPEEILLATAEEGATRVRRLTQDEMERAKDFLATEGALSDFLEAQEER